MSDRSIARAKEELSAQGDLNQTYVLLADRFGEGECHDGQPAGIEVDLNAVDE